MRIAARELGRRLQLRIASILALFILGCANSSNPQVFEARGFSDDEIITLQSAADEWCSKSNDAHCALVVKSAAGFETSTVVLTDTLEVEHSAAGIVLRTEHSEALGTCLATVDHLGIRSTAECAANPDAESFAIQIVNSRDGDCGVNWFHGQKTTWNVRLRTIFLHELGHTFGHIHTSTDNTVMNPVTTYQVEHLTYTDLTD